MLDDWRELIKKIQGNKYYAWFRAVLRGLALYVLYVIIYLFSVESILEAFATNDAVAILPYPKVWKAATLILFSILILNSLLFVFAVFNTKMRNRFFLSRWNQQKREKDVFSEDIKAEPNLYFIEFGTIAVCSFLFPIWYAYDAFWAMLPFSVSLPDIVDRLILTAGFTLIAFVLVLRVGKNAQSHWLQKQNDAYKKRGYVAGDDVNKRAYKKSKFVWRIFLYFIAYSIVSGIFCYAVAISYSVASGMVLVLQEGIVFVIIGAIAFLIIGRSFWKRVKFYVRLRRLCDKFRFRIIEKKHPLLSILRLGSSYHLAIEANGTVYYCRMIATLRRKNRLRFLPDGTFKRIFGVHLPTPQVMVTSQFAMGAVYIDSSHVDEREIFRLEREGTYAFDCPKDGKKILLLNPVPRRTMLGAGTYEPADNGDMIGEYSVYGGTAFLNALKNDAFYFDKHKK